MRGRPRVEVEGGFFHVFTRGNDRDVIFLDGNDYAAFLEIVERAVLRFGWCCHSYCLMPNHYHLVLETPQPTLAAGMRHVNGSYAQRLNRRYDRTGSRFDSRYNAILIEHDNQLLATLRYVMMNPVRARMCARPEQWRWSSARAVLGLEPPDELLAVSLVRALGEGIDGWRALFAAAIEAIADENRSRDLVAGPV